MSNLWPGVVLIALVAGVLTASRHPSYRTVFHWLPVPLWCYLLPMIGVTIGWLPSGHPAYRAMVEQWLPVALGLLLLSVNVGAVARTSRRALLAASVGAASIVIGAPFAAWLARSSLPADAWKGAGALAGTWTGGSMNLVALRTILDVPDAIFAPIVVVDTIVAYSWMALLVAAASRQALIDRWLGITTARPPQLAVSTRAEDARRISGSSVAWSIVVTLTLTVGARALSVHLPTSPLVSSANGWTVLLVTSAALGLSLAPWIRRVSASSDVAGYPCLYVVLAAIGAQARLQALWASPIWLVFGITVAVFHGGVLLMVGRGLRLPLGVLATASQANIGGVVSAPLVGAVYDQSLAPVGLLLAMTGNALGTYCGIAAAMMTRWWSGY